MPTSQSGIVMQLVIQAGLILALSRIMGLLFARLHQPQVMGEMVAGIMLGPSLFGLIWPHLYSVTFAEESIKYLNALSQVGVVFFLFLIGLELDPKLIRNRGHAAAIISNASIFVPFLLGAGLVWFLNDRLFNHATSMHFTSIALFMGAAMSITAFPVLARILTERNLHKTHVGAIAITSAAINDVTAWCLLAFVISAARAEAMIPAAWTVCRAVVFVLFMFYAVRPFLRRLELVYERSGRLSQNLLAIIFLLVLASSLATEWIGIHALFGAFLMGAIMPKGTAFVRTLSEKLEDYTVVFLLPIFFAYTGLRTHIDMLNHASLWWYTGLITACACFGKFGGSALAARVTGMTWRESSAIGILMNTRGLIELVILNIGRDLGVISDTVFAMMVIMALVTTALTTPLLHWVYPQAAVEAEELNARAKAAELRFTVLIPVALPASGGPLAAMAATLTPLAGISQKIIGLSLRRPVDREAYRAGLNDAQAPVEAFEPLMSEAKKRNLTVEPISFVSRDVPSDITRVARVRDADLILMGFHKPVFGQAILGGTVHRVMTGSDTDVAVFVDRSTGPITSIMVPYLGGKHDRLALELAGRIARNVQGSLTVLHVVKPKRAKGDAALHARTVVERTFAERGTATPVNFKVIEDESPVDGVVNESKNYDLVVIGVEEEWGLESHLFGWRPERVARETPGSLLIVRKYTGPKASRTAETTVGEPSAAPVS